MIKSTVAVLLLLVALLGLTAISSRPTNSSTGVIHQSTQIVSEFTRTDVDGTVFSYGAFKGFIGYLVCAGTREEAKRICEYYGIIDNVVGVPSFEEKIKYSVHAAAINTSQGDNARILFLIDDALYITKELFIERDKTFISKDQYDRCQYVRDVLFTLRESVLGKPSTKEVKKLN